MTGAYISEDGGKSWRMFSLRSPVKFFVFDPLDPQVIYAGAEVLWRSADRGRTWSLAFPSDSGVRIIMPDDHASPEFITDRGPAGRVDALAVDPADSLKLYATIGEGKAVALYLSTDRGAHWQRSADLPGGGRKIFVDPNSPPSDRTLYVLGENSVAVRTAGEWKQGPAPAGVGEAVDMSAGFSPSGKLTVYMVTGGGRRSNSSRSVIMSPDGGSTWTVLDVVPLRNADSGTGMAELTNVATSLQHPEVAYVSYEDLHAGGQVFHGVAKTHDSGKTWELVWKEASEPAPNVHDAWLSERFGQIGASLAPHWESRRPILTSATAPTSGARCGRSMAGIPGSRLLPKGRGPRLLDDRP